MSRGHNEAANDATTAGADRRPAARFAAAGARSVGAGIGVGLFGLVLAGIVGYSATASRPHFDQSRTRGHLLAHAAIQPHQPADELRLVAVVEDDRNPAESGFQSSGMTVDESPADESPADEAPAAEDPGDNTIEPAQPVQLTRSFEVRNGDTLGGILAKAGLGARDRRDVVAALSPTFNPRRLRQGQELTFLVEAEADGYRLISLTINEGPDRDIVVARNGAGFAVNTIVQQLQRRHAHAAGVIRGSLYAAAVDTGVPLAVLSEMIQVFSYDVDFQRDVHPGDGFDILFERLFDDEGVPVKDGNVVAASMTLRGKRLRYYRYTPTGESDADYFDARGNSARKPLLKTPIDGARLTSRYGRRNHPALGFSRMHQGLDFAAPTGTPVNAAGDAVVEFAGARNGYGRFVRLRHNSTLSTAYAHLSRITVRRGQRIKQGHVIGHVGASGLATGPHLHYELMVNGAPVNPLGVKMPTARQLAGKEFEKFQGAVGRIEALAAALPPTVRLVTN